MKNKLNSNFDVRDLIHVVTQSRAFILSVVGGSVLLFALASFVLPKKYKASGTLAIQTDYFRFPLIEEFIPSPTDPSEISAKRDALVRSAFDKSFLEQVGNQFSLLSAQPGTPAHDYELEELFRRYEIFSLSPTTVQIGFVGPSAEVAKQATDAGLEQVIKVYREERMKKIVKARDNIFEQIESMSLKKDPTKALLVARNPEILRSELKSVEFEIETLSRRFSDQHPAVVQLRGRAAALRGYLQSAPHTGESAKNLLSNAALPQYSAEVYDGLVKKLAYLNIALNMESDNRTSYVSVLEPSTTPIGALWPKKSLFLVWGLIVGLLVSAVTLLVREARLTASPRLRQLSTGIDLPLIGEMPRLPVSRKDTVSRKRKTPRADVR